MHVPRVDLQLLGDTSETGSGVTSACGAKNKRQGLSGTQFSLQTGGTAELFVTVQPHSHPRQCDRYSLTHRRHKAGRSKRSGSGGAALAVSSPAARSFRGPCPAHYDCRQGSLLLPPPASPITGPPAPPGAPPALFGPPRPSPAPRDACGPGARPRSPAPTRRQLCPTGPSTGSHRPAQPARPGRAQPPRGRRRWLPGAPALPRPPQRAGGWGGPAWWSSPQWRPGRPGWRGRSGRNWWRNAGKTGAEPAYIRPRPSLHPFTYCYTSVHGCATGIGTSDIG